MLRCRAVLALVVGLSLLAAVAFGESAIRVTVNGKAVAMDSPPVIVNGHTLVPLRAIFEAMGVAPVWDGKTGTVTASSSGVQLKLVVGSKTAFVNGKSVGLDEPGVIRNGRVMVPGRFIAETFGGKVDWNASARTVVITTGAKTALKTGPFAGMQAPDFTLKDLAGKSVKLSDLRGNSVALIFFTSW